MITANSTYLDYAATNPFIYKSKNMNAKFYINANSNYAHEEKKILLDCENRIKKAIGVRCGHILYFRTCSDAVRWLDNQKWDEIHISAIVHDSLLRRKINESISALFPCQRLIKFSYVNHLNGLIDEWLDEYIKKNIATNTAYGLYDFTQAIGKVKIPSLENVDCIVMSGHKIGCPFLSFMWMSDRLCRRLRTSSGIENQWGLVHGTLPVSLVEHLTECVEYQIENTERNIKTFDFLKSKLKTEFQKSKIDFEELDLLPQIGKSNAINLITLNGINADALQQYLASKDCYVGIAASACAGGSKDKYRVATELGLTEKQAEQSIRVSFGERNTEKDIERLVNLIVEYKGKFGIEK